MFTKRKFLNKIATLFDPLGLLAPYTIRAKLLLQEMWTAGLEWDDELPEALTHAARSWFSELKNLKQLQIPRCLGEKERTSDTMPLHTFVDASQDAYGLLYMPGAYTRTGLFRVTLLPQRHELYLAYQQVFSV